MKKLSILIPTYNRKDRLEKTFHEIISNERRKTLQLNFIQTCFAFTNPYQSSFANDVFSKLIAHSKGEITEPADLKSAVGFIHAYDLTKLFIQAVKQVGLSGEMNIDRNNIRLALENIDKPIQGLVKNYIKPFSKFDQKTNNNAHEALDLDSYCMAKFGIEGLTKALAMDLGKHGIRVNSVSPTKTIVKNSEIKNLKRLNLIKKKIPLGKFSTTEEIAKIVYFLTTSSAGSITGTTIMSDGGWTAGK